jgi:alkanesulfonate monooxygenase SsuD/methylene tetrahydromethanopterin reductase-like flavin-dependent oxidoreductase (luciferase family)
MRFGVMLPQSGPLASAAALVDIAQAAEDLDFYAVAARDHLSFDGAYTTCGMADVVPPGGDLSRMFECLGTLTYVASCTRRIRLNTSVIILPNRHPLLLAKQASTLDFLSNGRLTLGLGVGPNRHETDADTTRLSTHRDSLVKEYDSFGAYGPRGPRADEYFRALVELWTADNASFDGEYVHFSEVTMRPAPVQRPHPPVVVGGRSGAARSRAARWGAGWLPSQPTAAEIRLGVEDLARKRASLAAVETGASDIIGINVHSIFANSENDAVSEAHPTLGKVFPDREQYLSRTLSGNVDDWCDRLAEYQAVGVNYVELKPVVPSIHSFVEQLQTVHEIVMPRFA